MRAAPPIANNGKGAAGMGKISQAEERATVLAAVLCDEELPQPLNPLTPAGCPARRAGGDIGGRGGIRQRDFLQSEGAKR